MKKYTREKILALYEKGMGTVAIAKVFSLHRATVQRALKKAILLRNVSPWKNTYSTNFFGTLTKASCSILVA